MFYMDSSYIISPVKEKKSGKIWLWVLLIILVVGVVALLIWLFTTNRNSESSSNYWQDYADYLVFGVDKKEEVSGELSLQNVMNNNYENIYYLPRYYNFLEDTNLNYYKSMKDLLNKINEDVATKTLLTEETRAQIEGLTTESQKLLSIYFVGASLVYNNASYEYYLANDSLEGFLSDYGYPLDDNGNGAVYDWAGQVNYLFAKKQEYYNAINQANCLSETGIDYTCADASNVVMQAKGEMDLANQVVEDQIDVILSEVLNDAKVIGTSLES